MHPPVLQVHPNLTNSQEAAEKLTALTTSTFLQDFIKHTHIVNLYQLCSMHFTNIQISYKTKTI